MSTADDQKVAAVQGIAAALGAAGTAVGQPVAAETATAIGELLVDSLTKGTLNKLLADANAKAAAITTEDAAEIAARSRT